MVRYREIVETPDVKNVIKKYFQIFGTVATNTDGSVNVDGDVNCSEKYRDHKLPLIFHHVTGNFECKDCNINTLKGFPQIIGGNLNVESNSLTSLIGSPQQVGGDVRVSYNPLISLSGSTNEIKGSFYCDHNRQLTSLQGGPKSVAYHFWSLHNELTTLEGLPEVDGNIFITWFPNMPLLRLVGSIVIFRPPKPELTDILRKYQGRDNLRSKIIACQKDLIDAGFEGNASW